MAESLGFLLGYKVAPPLDQLLGGMGSMMMMFLLRLILIASLFLLKLRPIIIVTAGNVWDNMCLGDATHGP
jgi:hypothetical protein